MPEWSGNWQVLFQHAASSPKLGISYVQASSPTTTLKLKATTSSLVVGQDLAKYGIAGVVWNCVRFQWFSIVCVLGGSPSTSLSNLFDVLIQARAMVSFIEAEPQFAAQRHVLELGAGPGAVGLALASACEVSSMLLTDLESVVPLTQDNARFAAQQDASIATLIATNRLDVRPLCWGEPLDDTIATRPVDVVVASDCLYESALHSALLSTLTDISKRDQQAQASRHLPIVLLAYKQRVPE
ncbi:S-adenosyl-L-methionine-dependent methyltransferase [Phytophthora cactorum]|nr:S-adenosyl-L-methionine-dependent methyltransferase [Phytophthora cactorum]